MSGRHMQCLGVNCVSSTLDIICNPSISGLTDDMPFSEESLTIFVVPSRRGCTPAEPIYTNQFDKDILCV